MEMHAAAPPGRLSLRCPPSASQPAKRPCNLLVPQAAAEPVSNPQEGGQKGLAKQRPGQTQQARVAIGKRRPWDSPSAYVEPDGRAKQNTPASVAGGKRTTGQVGLGVDNHEGMEKVRLLP